jgi:hypothetical protein
MRNRVGIHCVLACFSLSLCAVPGCGVASEGGQGEKEDLGVVKQAVTEPDRRYYCKCAGSVGSWYQSKTPTRADIRSGCPSRRGGCRGNGHAYLWNNAYSVSNTDNATLNYDNLNIDLNANDQLLFGGCAGGRLV